MTVPVQLLGVENIKVVFSPSKYHVTPITAARKVKLQGAGTGVPAGDGWNPDGTGTGA